MDVGLCSAEEATAAVLAYFPVFSVRAWLLEERYVVAVAADDLILYRTVRLTIVSLRNGVEGQ